MVDPLPLDVFVDRVAQGIARATHHGLHRPGDVCWFVTLTFTLSPRFDRAAFIARCLSDPDVPAGDRVQHLLSWSTDADWEEASRQ